MGNFNLYWDDIHKKYTSTYDDWLNKYTKLFRKDFKFVELGCGRAYCSNYLISEGFSDVIATDFSSEVLKMVQEENKDLQTMLFDMTGGLPFGDNSVDVVIADLCLHYFDSEMTKYIIKEISRVLKKDGYLLVRVNSTIEVQKKIIWKRSSIIFTLKEVFIKDILMRKIAIITLKILKFTIYRSQQWIDMIILKYYGNYVLEKIR